MLSYVASSKSDVHWKMHAWSLGAQRAVHTRPLRQSWSAKQLAMRVPHLPRMQVVDGLGCGAVRAIKSSTRLESDAESVVASAARTVVAIFDGNFAATLSVREPRSVYTLLLPRSEGQL